MNTATFTNGHASLDDLLDMDAEPFTGTTEPAPAPAKRKGPKPAAAAAPVVLLAPVVPTPAPEAPESAITTLADDTLALTRRLARSLGLPATDDAPSPSAFVSAIERIHAGLTQARADLGAWADELGKREHALEAREKAVERREAEAAASLALAGLVPPTGRPARRPGLLARLLRRGR